MDKNLNSSPTTPWWLLILQIALPILAQVALELAKSNIGTPVIGVSPHGSAEIPVLPIVPSKIWPES